MPGNKKDGQITSTAAVEHSRCKKGAFNLFISQDVRAAHGRTDPRVVNSLLRKVLEAQ